MKLRQKNAVFEAVFHNRPSPAKHTVEENTDDQLSFVAGNEFNDDINEDAQALDTGTEPPHTVNKPPDTAIKPTNSPPAMSPVDGQIHTDKSASVMSDPETQANSWSPSPVFHSFLEKQFHRKLSYEQVCDILEQQAIPAINFFVAPTLDHSVINQIPAQNRKYVQEHDKELSVIQNSMLNATGPLCSLLDRIENNFDLNPSEIKLVLEQALCLLGSANNQLSVLCHKKVLASVNKSKIELANQPFPNAKKWLFGEEFPAIASKEADLAGGLAKNFGQNGSKNYTKPTDFKTSTGNDSQPSYNKYQSFRGRNKFFRPRRSLPRQNYTSNNGKQ